MAVQYSDTQSERHLFAWCPLFKCGYTLVFTPNILTSVWGSSISTIWLWTKQGWKSLLDECGSLFPPGTVHLTHRAAHVLIYNLHHLHGMVINTKTHTNKHAHTIFDHTHTHTLTHSLTHSLTKRYKYYWSPVSNSKRKNRIDFLIFLLQPLRFAYHVLLHCVVTHTRTRTHWELLFNISRLHLHFLLISLLCSRLTAH